MPRHFCESGCFSGRKFILGMLFCSTGIISSVRMHPWHALLFHRDYFFRPDASQACSFVPQGLFLPSECIPGMLFCSTGIFFFVRMHLWHAFLFHRMHPNAEIHPCRDISANQDAAGQSPFGPWPPANFNREFACKQSIHVEMWQALNRYK